MKILKLLRRLRDDEKGISAVEYAILIGVVGVGMATALGTSGADIAGYVTEQIELLTAAE